MVGTATALLGAVTNLSFGCEVRWKGERFWIIFGSNDQRISLMKTGRAIIFLIGSVPIVFTGDIRFQAGWQMIGSIKNPKRYENANAGYRECE